MRKLAVVASHPIQYQAPLFRALAKACDLTVYFCHRQSAAEQGHAGFGEAFQWDVPLLDGYRFEWLENVSARPGVDRFSGCDTPGLRERLARGTFDACLVNGWYLKSYLQAIRACKAHDIPVMVRGDSHLGGDRAPLTRAVKYLPYRWMLGRIDAHLFVGRANYEYLRHYGVSKAQLFFAPHFVDNERFAAGATAARESGAASARRTEWGAGPEDVLFLYVGKLIGIKRVQDFVTAVSRANRKDPRVRGAIVGSGPEESGLRALADRERAPIHFAGFHNQSVLPACYAAADCLVLPSSTESWGLVINEAMATGMPAVVSDRVGAAPDLIEQGVTGFVYPSGDVDTLASRLLATSEALTLRGDEIRTAVANRIARYSCANAVASTIAALEVGAAKRIGSSVAVGNGHA